ncbi:hypothetical protein ACL90Y_02435 [Micrococcus luteus]
MSSTRRTGELTSALDEAVAAQDGPPALRGERAAASGERAIRAAARVLAADTLPDRWASAAITLQQPVATGRRIAVLSPAGGVGRSALVAAMARELRAFRSDVVARLDLADHASGQAGTTPGPAPTPRTAWAALRDQRPETRLDFLRILADPDTGHVDVHTAPPEPALDAEDVVQLLAEVSRHSAVTLVECPAGHTDPRTRAAVSTAHALVVVGRQDRASVRAVFEYAADLREAYPRTPVLAVANGRDRVGAPWHAGLTRSVAERALAWTAVGHSRVLRRGPRPEAVLEIERRLEVMHTAAVALTLARGLPAAEATA